jgi:hypothetical protein
MVKITPSGWQSLLVDTPSLGDSYGFTLVNDTLWTAVNVPDRYGISKFSTSGLQLAHYPLPGGLASSAPPGFDAAGNMYVAGNSGAIYKIALPSNVTTTVVSDGSWTTISGAAAPAIGFAVDPSNGYMCAE